jgi:serine/threonine-protein kinase RsbW
MVGTMEERRFPRGARLEALFEFIDAFVSRHGIHADAAFDLRLALEELFTNSVKYHPESREDILVRLDKQGPFARMTIQDFDVEDWDVTRAPAADVDAPLEARTPGGLGIHLVRRITDSFEYEHRDRSSTITVTKRVED